MNLKSLPVVLLRISLGLVLIFSGFIKLYPIEPFELNFIDIGIANWFIAPFMARGIIALEIFLGIMLVVNFYTKKIVLPSVAVLLIFFIGYLIFAIIKEGNQGNCGCFGTYLEMTPLESIIKNVVILAIAFIVYKFGKEYQWKYISTTTYALAAATIMLPFILNPPDLMASTQAEITNTGYEFETKYLGEYTFSGSKPDFSKGNHIVAFFLTTCPHCKSTALKLSILKRKSELPPVYAVIAGKEKYLQKFIEESKWNLPYYYYTNKDLMKLSGTEFPAIFYIKDGKVQAKWNNLSMNEEEIKKVLK
jgi:uncharacterized membrane protein YphA (DoxX/SURF4 family)